MMTLFRTLGMACTLLIAAACDGRQADPAADPAWPGTGVQEPQTMAPGVAPGEEPLPRAFPGVQEDTAIRPGSPPPDAEPGI
jgi:hypothetical protein